MPIMESEHSSMIKSDKDCPSIANNISNNNNNTDTLSGHKSVHLSTTNMVSSMIKHEVVDSGFENKCVMISSKSHNSQVPTAAECASLATTTALVSSASSNMNMAASSNNNNSSPKMGSRRIFTPQFKLQVLESYRNDNDCKGNQRATARKYNIHRRQIQKWLQCESSLRSSVANINQSNVKHQFHNISHQHQPQQHQQQQLQMPIAAATSGNSHFSHHHHQQQLLHNHNQHLLHHHHHHHQQQQQLSLDTTRQSVALNSITVPSLPAGVASTSAAAASAQGVLAAANLAAVVAAAAGAAGAMAIANNTSSSSTNTNTNSSTQQQQTVVSPLRPTAIGGSTGATLSPSMLHPHHQPQRHQHHHLYPMPYTHTPASVPVSVPILTHHIPPQHLHHHYQYHNLSPHAHALPQTQQQSQQQPLAFMPSACLPVTVLSATTTAASNAPTQGDAHVEGAENRTSDELRESSTTKATTTTLAATGATLTGNSYMHGVEYVYKCTENGGGEPNEVKYKGLPKYPYMLHHQQQQPSSTVSPMDLSVGPRRENREHFIHVDLRSSCKFDDVPRRTDQSLSKGVVNNNNDVVDLTFRKRKVIATANALAELDDDEQPEKLAKFNAADIKTDSSESESIVKVEVVETENSEDDVEVEVEEKSPPSKPVKLFKPYLLDGDDDDEDNSADRSEDKPLNKKSAGLRNNSESLHSSEQREPIIWSNHPGCMSPHSYDSRQNSSCDSNFQSPSVEKYTFPIGSPYFHGNKSSPQSPQSALSPTPSAPAMSPASFRCPKGSPVSGYESSSSTYSESSSRSEHESSFNRTYSLDLQMHRVYHDHLMTPTQPQQNHVQRWLDQDTSTNMNSTPPAANDASIYMLKILQ